MPTSDSASSATPSTSSATPSATPPSPPPDPTTTANHPFMQHPSADVAVNYCRQTPQRPHWKHIPVGSPCYFSRAAWGIFVPPNQSKSVEREPAADDLISRREIIF